jgi:hypothetical protein
LVTSGIDDLDDPVELAEVLTPQARAGIGWPMMTLSPISPQSLQTMPSKPSSLRSSSVITPWLKAKPTSSQSVPTGMP